VLNFISTDSISRSLYTSQIRFSNNFIVFPKSSFICENLFPHCECNSYSDCCFSHHSTIFLACTNGIMCASHTITYTLQTLMSLRTHSLPPSSQIPPSLRYHGGSPSSVNNYLIGLSLHQSNRYCCTVCAFDIRVAFETHRLFELAFRTSLSYLHVCVAMIRILSLARQLTSHAVNVCTLLLHHARRELYPFQAVSTAYTHTTSSTIRNHYQPLSTTCTHMNSLPIQSHWQQPLSLYKKDERRRMKKIT
jgi:hypothetical protein